MSALLTTYAESLGDEMVESLRRINPACAEALIAKAVGIRLDIPRSTLWYRISEGRKQIRRVLSGDPPTTSVKCKWAFVCRVHGFGSPFRWNETGSHRHRECLLCRRERRDATLTGRTELGRCIRCGSDRFRMRTHSKTGHQWMSCLDCEAEKTRRYRERQATRIKRGA